MLSHRVSIAILLWLLLSDVGVGHASVVVDPEAEVNQAIGDLSAADAKRRYWGTVILGRYPEAASQGLPALLASVEDSEWPVRLGVARALEALAPYSSSEELASRLALLLRDPTDQVRAAASFALAEVGLSTEQALPPLRSGTESSSSYLRFGSWVALRRLFPESISEESMLAASQLGEDLLMATLDAEFAWDPYDGTWSEAPGITAIRLARSVAILSPLHANSLVPELVQRYLTGSSAALHASRAAAPHLTAFTNDWLASCSSKDPQVQQEAILAVGLLGISSREAVGLLVDLLEQELVAGTAARALGVLGSEAKEAAVGLEELVLDSRDPSVRYSAGLALIQIDRSRIAHLATRLRRTDPELAERLETMALLSQL